MRRRDGNGSEGRKRGEEGKEKKQKNGNKFDGLSSPGEKERRRDRGGGTAQIFPDVLPWAVPSDAIKYFIFLPSHKLSIIIIINSLLSPLMVMVMI